MLIGRCRLWIRQTERRRKSNQFDAFFYRNSFLGYTQWIEWWILITCENQSSGNDRGRSENIPNLITITTHERWPRTNQIESVKMWWSILRFFLLLFHFISFTFFFMSRNYFVSFHVALREKGRNRILFFIYDKWKFDEQIKCFVIHPVHQLIK